MLSGQAFCSAFEKTHTEGVSAYLLGKRLIDLQLVFSVSYPDTENGLAAERIRLHALDPDIEQDYAGLERFERDPDGAQEYQDAAAQVLDVVLDDAVDLRALPEVAFEFDYVARRHDTTRRRHASSFRDRPSKQSIVSAKVMLNDIVFPHIEDETFPVTPRQRLLDLLFEDEVPYADRVRHYWALKFRSDLPLNGQEGRSYLENYIHYGEQAVLSANVRKETLEAQGFGPSLTDMHVEDAQQWNDAVERAKEFLSFYEIE